MKTFRSFAALLLMTLLAPSLRAGVIYNNLGTADSFNKGLGWTIGLVGTSTNWWQGFQFKASSSGFVSSLDVAIGYTSLLNETVTFGLYADSSGTLGTLLEQISVIATQKFGAATQTGVESALALGTTFLTAGSAYWLMATAPSWTAWNQNDTGGFLPRASTDAGFNSTLAYSTNIAGAFRLNSVPESVPEPATLALLGLGLAGIGAMRRKKLAA